MEREFVDGKNVVIVTRLHIVINNRSVFKWTVLQMVLWTYVDLIPYLIGEWGGF